VRSQNAPLSPAEFEALRSVESGATMRISTERRAMLLGMGLVRLESSGGLALTDMGALRLRQMEDGHRHGEETQAGPEGDPECESKDEMSNQHPTNQFSCGAD